MGKYKLYSKTELEKERALYITLINTLRNRLNNAEARLAEINNKLEQEEK